MFASLLSRIDKKERPIQTQYEKAVERALAMPHKISLIQAETGVGKSLAYSYAALNALLAHQGSRVIIASSTIQLLHALHDEAIPDAISMLAPTITPKTDLIMGLSNYVSAKRLRNVMRDFSTTELALHRDEFDILLAWNDEIEDYLAEYAELPLGIRSEQICQTHYEKEDWYVERRSLAIESDILIVSHAMLISDMTAGGKLLAKESDERPVYLIIDEADQLSDAMEAYQEVRLNLLDLSSGLRRLSKPFSLLEKNTQLLSDMVFENCTAGDYFRAIEESELQWVRGALSSIEKGLSRCTDEDGTELRHYIHSALASDVSRMGYGLSRILKEPSIVFINPFFTRLFASYARKHQATVLTSGSLSISSHDEQGVSWLLKAFNIKTEDIGVVDFFAPKVFGDMQFVFAGKNFPANFLSSNEQLTPDLNPQWLITSASHIKTIKGKTLILTGSHRESERLAELLQSTALTVHTRGTKLSKVAKSYLSERQQYLITAGGKVGVNLRDENGGQLFEHIVITRIPFSPPQATQEEYLATYLLKNTNIHNPKQAAQLHFFNRNISNAIRQLKQAFGRGIRSETDTITITILDNRFPLATTTTKMNVFKAVIPERFRTNFQHAAILTETQRRIQTW